MTTVTQRTQTRVCCTIAAMILLLGCGGKTVSNASSPGHGGDGGSGGSGSAGTVGTAGTGGTSAQAGSGGTGQGGGEGGAQQGGMAGEAGADPGSGGCGPIPPWDHKCHCKNWTDDAYYPEFFSEGSCVLGGQWACPPDYVCCARSCMSPDICIFTGEGGVGCSSAGPCAERQCCMRIGDAPNMCVRPDQCAPEGVLVVRPQTPKDVVDKKCWW